MSAQPQRQPLQAGVQKQVTIAPQKSLQDVIDLNGGDGWWSSLGESDRNEISDQYRQKYLEPEFEKNQLEQPDRDEILTQFNQKYKVGQVKTAYGQPTNKLPFVAGFGQPDQLTQGVDTAALFSRGITQPLGRAASANLFDPNQVNDIYDQARKNYPGIETDPGLLGQAYRFQNNPIAQGLGGLVGALGGARNVALNLPKLGAAGVAAAYSGLSNAVSLGRGEQTPIEALGNTALDVGLGKLQGASRFGNAALQGAGGAISGAASSALSDLTRGQPIDMRRLQQAALREAALGAGLGAATGKARSNSKVQPKYQNFENARSVGVIDRRTGRVLNDEQAAVRRFKRAASSRLNQAAGKESINQTESLKLKSSALKREYDQLTRILNDPEASPQQKAIAQKLRGRAQQGYEAVQKKRQEPQRQKQKARVAEKQYNAEYKKLVAEEKAAQARQKTLKAEAQKIQNAKERQAAQSQLRLERAESQQRQRELSRLKADIKARNADNLQQVKERGQAVKNTAAKPETPAKGRAESKPEPQADKPKVDPIKAKATLEKAIAEGKPIQVEHRANKMGTREESSFRQKNDLPYEMGSNEKGDFVRVINENGQITMRYLDDMHGEVQISNERFPYRHDTEGIYRGGKKKGESGRFRVLDEDGNEVDQTPSKLTKDKDVQANIDKMAAIVDGVKSGKKVKVSDILDAARTIENMDDMAGQLEKLPPKARKETHKKLTGEDC